MTPVSEWTNVRKRQTRLGYSCRASWEIAHGSCVACSCRLHRKQRPQSFRMLFSVGSIGRSSRRVPAGTGMAVREAWGAAAQSGDVVPQHTDLRPVRWASLTQRIDLSVRCVSLPPMRLAV